MTCSRAGRNVDGHDLGWRICRGGSACGLGLGRDHGRGPDGLRYRASRSDVGCSTYYVLLCHSVRLKPQSRRRVICYDADACAARGCDLDHVVKTGSCPCRDDCGVLIPSIGRESACAGSPCRLPQSRLGRHACVIDVVSCSAGFLHASGLQRRRQFRRRLSSDADGGFGAMVTWNV